MLMASTLLAALFITIMRSPQRAHATCGATWHVWAEHTDRQTTDTEGGQTTETQDISSHSIQISDHGETTTSNESFHRNVDGSSTEHSEFTYEDKHGDGCNGDGEPWSGNNTRDVKTDAEGNSEEHIEEIIEKDGKCIKSVRDRAWDRTGKLIKDTGWKDTEIPCPTPYSLEVSVEGTISIPNGTIQWHPTTVTIPLARKGDIYTGTYQGEFKATQSGNCSGEGIILEIFDVTAKEDLPDLAFTINRTTNVSAFGSCPSGPGSNALPTISYTLPFTLPIRDGASWSIGGSGEPKWTYTFRERNKP
jgi:hypothetical protein